ncbi:MULTISPECIES: hypothetical protein [Sphingomonas]|uniref:hypothetical protein n=1 Tax=Sphingomonas TaxID=13687 RepID=UPI001269A203|nr:MULTISPECIES: hypothetical protein [Sphingomonas]
MPDFHSLRTFAAAAKRRRMAKQIDLEGIEAARMMAALSSETKRRFDKATWRLTRHSHDVAPTAFNAIGVAIG